MMQYSHEDFMYRCLQLAKLGEGNVEPNPVVGAVLVHNNTIIGEGYHKQYGEAHAEVNCIKSVNAADINLIKDAILYVSLEPCDHFGKTPPCTDLIIHNKISKVIIGCRDSFTKVNGKGILKLKDNNVDVIVGILENECKEINKKFFLFHALKRPYIILKWAQTADNKIAFDDDKRLLISCKLSARLVHKWRFLEPGIMIGTNTALKDNPHLTNRLWTGKSPVRFVIDKNSKLKTNFNIFNSRASTIVITQNSSVFPIINIMLSSINSLFFGSLPHQPYSYIIEKDNNVIEQLLRLCYQLNIQSILVEGGAKTLQSFIDKNLFDEIRTITNKNLYVEKGLEAPKISGCNKTQHFFLRNDEVKIFSKIK